MAHVGVQKMKIGLGGYIMIEDRLIVWFRVYSKLYRIMQGDGWRETWKPHPPHI